MCLACSNCERKNPAAAALHALVITGLITKQDGGPSAHNGGFSRPLRPAHAVAANLTPPE